MLEPDDGKLSSPVLRGLAPSNGGRLLGGFARRWNVWAGRQNRPIKRWWSKFGAAPA
jgi:hypothetical protein